MSQWVHTYLKLTMPYFDYLSLMRELGFTNVIELAHGEILKFEGGQVVSVPFFGENPCDLALPRNCYLISDRGHNTLVHADSGPTNDGKSALQDSNLSNNMGPLRPSMPPNNS